MRNKAKLNTTVKKYFINKKAIKYQRCDLEIKFVTTILPPAHDNIQLNNLTRPGKCDNNTTNLGITSYHPTPIFSMNNFRI